jgi:ligand-binding SRPBCC domain-containing protein
MPTIYLTTFIDAQVQTCFDLARNIEVHQISTSKTKEKAIGGRTSGLCEQGDVITWEAFHFGIKQRLTVKMTKMEPFLYFEDEMIKGAFSSMRHKHSFEVHQRGTKMTDEFVFKAPLGIFGSITEKIFLTRYLTNVLKERNSVLKSLAEAK